jgi:hypothetical protein
MNIIDELREKYATHEFMKQKLENYIQHLPVLMKTIEEDYHKKQTIKKEMNQQKEDFIEEFLSTYYFFYIQQTELFVEHLETYSIISEDYIVHLIGTKLDRPLIPYKAKIIQSILKKIKENLFIHVSDEYIANQIIQTLPFPHDLSIYFLTILGDIILNKHTNLVYYMDASYKPFLKDLNQSIYVILNKSFDVFKHKYYDHKYYLCRVLTGKCINYELPNILNLIVSAVFMSTKYENSDGFLLQNQAYTNEITILRRNTPDTLIQLFLENMIKKEEGTTIPYKDVYFLWQSFLRKQYLPFVISQQNLKLSLIQLGICDGDICLNMTALTQTNLLKFKHFWEKYFIPDEDDFYELYEIVDLCKDKTVSIEIIKEVLSLYPTTIENNCVLNIKCSLWNKTNDIDNAIEVFKHHDSYSTNLPEMYAFYTEYVQLHHKRVVTQDYFEKYFKYTDTVRFI